MRFWKVSVVCILLFIVSSGSSVFYPLNEEHAKDGCLDYASDTNRIIGNPDTSEGYKSVYIYDFALYFPQIEAKFDDLFIEVKRTDGFDSIKDCSGPYGVLAKINDVRANVDSDYDYKDYVLIYPGAPLLEGENTIFMTNMSERTYCTGGSLCSDKKSGICAFRICGFYPELEIATSSPPNLINRNENFSISVNITNNYETDAGSVTITVSESDFYVSPSKTTQTILAKDEAPFNELKYSITFTPKRYVELDTGGTSVPKRIGKIVATFTDVNLKERQFEKNIGAITVTQPLISQNTTNTTPATTSNDLENKNSTPISPPSSQKPSDSGNRSNICLPGFLFLLLPLLFFKH